MRKWLLIAGALLCLVFVLVACAHAVAWYCLRQSDFPSYPEQDMVRKYSWLRRARLYEPDNPRVYCELGEMYDELREKPFLVYEIQKKPDLAKRFPELPKTDREIGRECLKHAIHYYEQAQERDPNNAAYHYRLGRARLEIPTDVEEFGRDRASSEFETAIRLDPNNPLYHYWMGVYYQTSGMLEGAVSKYRETIDLDRRYGPRVLKTAWDIDHYAPTLMAIAKGHEALETSVPGFLIDHKALPVARAACISVCQRADDYSPASQVELLSRLLQLGEPALARLVVLEWMEKKPSVELELMLVSALELGGQRDIAIGRMRKLVAQNNANANLHACLADLYRSAKRFEDAVREYEEAIKLAPKNGDHYDTLARCYWQQKDYASATQEYERLAAILPTSSYVQYQIGNGRMAMDDVDGAITAFREAIRLSPNDKRFKRALLIASGRRAEAAKNKKDSSDAPQ